jgi:hypothetical protein
VPGVLLCQAYYCARRIIVPGVLLCQVCYCARCIIVPGVLLCQVYYCARRIIVPGVLLCQVYSFVVLILFFFLLRGEASILLLFSVFFYRVFLNVSFNSLLQCCVYRKRNVLSFLYQFISVFICFLTSVNLLRVHLSHCQHLALSQLMTCVIL